VLKRVAMVLAGLTLLGSSLIAGSVGAQLRARDGVAIPAPTNVVSWAADTGCIPDLAFNETTPLCPYVQISWDEPSGYSANPQNVSVEGINTAFSSMNLDFWGSPTNPKFGFAIPLNEDPGGGLRSLGFNQVGSHCVLTMLLDNFITSSSLANLGPIVVSNTDGQGNFASVSGDWQLSSFPMPTELSETSSTGSLTVTWSAASSSGPLPNGFTPTGTYTATAYPNGASCTTSLLTCTIRGLNPRLTYNVMVASNMNIGQGPPATFPTAVYPMPSSKLTVEAIPVAVRGQFTVVASGAPEGSTVTLGVPGTQTSCTANAVGQCTVTLSETKAGSYNVLAVAGKQSAATPVWVPAISVPKGATHGKSFTVSIQHAPPKAAVVITTNDGRTINATTNAAGGASVAIKTTVRAFLTVTVSIAGTSFPAYNVQVS